MKKNESKKHFVAIQKDLARASDEAVFCAFVCLLAEFVSRSISKAIERSNTNAD